VEQEVEQDHPQCRVEESLVEAEGVAEGVAVAGEEVDLHEEDHVVDHEVHQLRNYLMQKRKG